MIASPAARTARVLLLGLFVALVLAGCAGGRGDGEALRVIDVDGDLMGRYWVIRQAQTVFVAPPAPRDDCGDGFVTVRFLIDSDGQVGASEILGAEPPGCYEAAALKLLQSWRFVPTGFNRKRQPVRVTQRIPFSG